MEINNEESKFKIDYAIEEVIKNPLKSFFTYNDTTATFIGVYADSEYPDEPIIFIYSDFPDRTMGTEYADGGHEDSYSHSQELFADYPETKDYFYLEFDSSNFDFSQIYIALVEDATKRIIKN